MNGFAPPAPPLPLPARLPGLSTFERLFTVPKITGAASLSKLWGRMAGGLAFEVEEGPGGVWEWTIAYSGHKIGQERGPVMEENPVFNFPQEKNECTRDRIIFQCAGPK